MHHASARINDAACRRLKTRTVPGRTGHQQARRSFNANATQRVRGRCDDADLATPARFNLRPDPFRSRSGFPATPSPEQQERPPVAPWGGNWSVLAQNFHSNSSVASSSAVRSPRTARRSASGSSARARAVAVTRAARPHSWRPPMSCLRQRHRRTVRLINTYPFKWDAQSAVSGE